MRAAPQVSSLSRERETYLALSEVEVRKPGAGTTGGDYKLPVASLTLVRPGAMGSCSGKDCLMGQIYHAEHALERAPAPVVGRSPREDARDRGRWRYRVNAFAGEDALAMLVLLAM